MKQPAKTNVETRKLDDQPAERVMTEAEVMANHAAVTKDNEERHAAMMAEATAPLAMPAIKLEDRETWPKPRSSWRHKNGNNYFVIAYTNVETDRQDEYPTTVIYENVETRRWYSRPLMEWSRSMTLIEY